LVGDEDVSRVGAGGCLPPPLGRICSIDERPRDGRTPPQEKIGWRLLSVQGGAVRLILESGIDP
jgi:hypothetical protein